MPLRDTDLESDTSSEIHILAQVCVTYKMFGISHKYLLSALPVRADP